MMNIAVRDAVVGLVDEGKFHWQQGRPEAATQPFEEAVTLCEANELNDPFFIPYYTAVEVLAEIFKSKSAHYQVKLTKLKEEAARH